MPGQTQLPQGWSSLPPGWSATAPTTGSANENPPPPPTTLQYIGREARDAGIGALKGAGSTANAIGHILVPDWAVRMMGGTPPTPAQEASYFAPKNTTQAVGKGVEQAAEYLLPTGLEEGGAKLGAKLLPRAGELLGRMGGAALHSGAINKAQGGGFGTGAAMGAAGAGVGAGLKKIAPVLAESALKIRGTDRAYGATPGRAILEDTKGISPRRIAESARATTEAIGDERDALLRNNPNLVPLEPAKDVLKQSVDRAYEENHPSTIKDMESLSNQLQSQYSSERPTLTELIGQAREMKPGATAAELRKIAQGLQAEHAADLAIPDYVPGMKASALNRGIANATIFNPAAQSDTVNTAGKQAHHVLGESIAQIEPRVRPLNQRIQSLFPVIQRGNAADLNAGFLQRSLGRFGAHTGALAGGLGGGLYGYKEGGLPGAAMGSMLGVLGPEVISAPETGILAARASHSPAMRKFAAPVIEGGALQFTRKKAKR